MRSLNRLLTPCADGHLNADCQALYIDYSFLDMTDTEQTDFQESFTKGLGIIKGKLIQTQQNGVSFPVLTAYEIWLAQVAQKPGCRLYFSLHETIQPLVDRREFYMRFPLMNFICRSRRRRLAAILSALEKP